MLRRAMAEAGLHETGQDDLVDTVLLLASELCDNATLHAGTEFEVDLSISPDECWSGSPTTGPGRWSSTCPTPPPVRPGRHPWPWPDVGRAAGHRWGTGMSGTAGTGPGSR